jgi:hypothetical protein
MRVASIALTALALALSAWAPSSGSTVVLGRKGQLPHGIGWGTAHPRTIFNGGDPNGRAWALRWTDWGAPATHARGRTWLFKPDGGYYSKPGAIELRASRIARCTPHGPRAYTRLQAREAVRPGGPLGHWFTWGGWKSLCSAPD